MNFRLTTVERWLANAGAAAGHRLVRPAGPARHVLPAHAPAVFLEQARRAWAPVPEVTHRVVTLSDAQVFGPGGAVTTADGALLLDSLHVPHRLPDYGFEMPNGPMPDPSDLAAAVTVPESCLDLITRRASADEAPQVLPGTSLLVGCHWDGNHHHWLMDGFARLALLSDAERRGVDRLLMLHPDTPVKRRCLDHAGLADRPIVFLSATQSARCERLLMPSRLCRVGFASPEGVAWLRRVLLGRRRRLHQALPRIGGRRLFISRADTATRRLDNEDEVFGLLARAGFERVTLTGLSLDEQIALFASARMIAGAHGAGFANLLFAPRGALVIELFPADWLIPCYWSLAGVRGDRYVPVIGTPLGDGGGFTVPAEAVQKALPHQGERL